MMSESDGFPTDFDDGESSSRTESPVAPTRSNTHVRHHSNGIDSYPGGSTDEDVEPRCGKCKQCCGNCLYEALFMDNSTQFSCMLFFGFIPIIVILLIGIIAGAVELSKRPKEPLIGVCIILGHLALSCFVYAGVGTYIVYYRRRYSPNIGSHGYFPFFGRE